MKVSELIEQLQRCNPEAVVLTMAYEDANRAKSVWTREQNDDEERRMYFKSDSPSEYISGDYVIITDAWPYEGK